MTLRNTTRATIQAEVDRIKAAIEIVSNGDDFAACNGKLERLYEAERRARKQLEAAG